MKVEMVGKERREERVRVANSSNRGDTDQGAALSPTTITTTTVLANHSSKERRCVHFLCEAMYGNWQHFNHCLFLPRARKERKVEKVVRVVAHLVAGVHHAVSSAVTSVADGVDHLADQGVRMGR